MNLLLCSISGSDNHRISIDNFYNLSFKERSKKSQSLITSCRVGRLPSLLRFNGMLSPIFILSLFERKRKMKIGS